MSALIFKLSDHKPKPKTMSPPHYFCQQCEGDTFKALANGKMHCASCGAGIKNLTVTFHPESA